MVCRAPTLNGTPKRLRNKAGSWRCPASPTSPSSTPASRCGPRPSASASTRSGRCEVDVEPRPGGGRVRRDIVAGLQGRRAADRRGAGQPAGARRVERDFMFYFRSNSAMEHQLAVADVRADRATVWAGAEVADRRPGADRRGARDAADQVTVNVVTGGGSFGRRLFFDGALEAAKISQAMGKPVKLMWHRADDARVGARATRWRPAGSGRPTLGGEVLSLRAAPHQRRDRLPARARRDHQRRWPPTCPAGWATSGFAETIFALTQEVPYDFGVGHPDADRDRRAVQHRAACATSTRPTSACASELVVDQLAARDEAGPLRVPPPSSCATSGSRRCSTRSPRRASWGRAMPRRHRPGHRDPQGVQGRHAPAWSRSTAGPRTVGRDIRDGVSGPRVTKVVYAIDAGLRGQPARPRGPDAGRHQRRHRAGADLEPAPARRPLPRGQLGQLLLHAAVEHPARRAGLRDALRRAASRRRRRGRGGGHRSPRWPAPTPGRPAPSRRTSRSTTATRCAFRPKPSSRRSRSRPPTASKLTY